ncbi:AAA family ATPase [Chamaesiphon sp.]|uniref:AAA family ATPase n=1 Tax=Chamaesiphon sp. TaxID=2814140 RepID=UPI0035940B69
MLDLISKYPIISLEIAVVDRRNTLEKLQFIANELDRPARIWSVFTAEFQALDRSTAVSIADNPAAQIVRLLAELHNNRTGLYIFDDLFATLNALNSIDRESCYQAISRLFAVLNRAAERNCTVIFLESGRAEIPSCLRQIIWEYKFPLPTTTELNKLLLTRGIDLTQSARLSNILAGLTIEEIKIGMRAWSHLTDPQAFGEKLLEYKYQVFATYGLEFMSGTTTKDIGGLEQIKTALKQVQMDFSPAARAANLPLPRGWLLVGIPGAGKSYLAKQAAKILGFPLISVGIDVAKSGGAKKFKQLLNRIDAIEPCIIYFDEFDKFFIGEDSGEFLGIILTYLQEKTSRTFVLATMNRMNLPTPLKRSGRFDKIFYLDFPTDLERKQILQLHCARFDRAYADLEHGRMTGEEWMNILEATNNYTGAELEHIAIVAAKSSFYRNPAAAIQIGIDDLLAAQLEVASIYTIDPEGVSIIQNESKGIAQPASSIQASPFNLPEINIWS